MTLDNEIYHSRGNHKSAYSRKNFPLCTTLNNFLTSLAPAHDIAAAGSNPNSDVSLLFRGWRHEAVGGISAVEPKRLGSGMADSFVLISLLGGWPRGGDADEIDEPRGILAVVFLRRGIATLAW